MKVYRLRRGQTLFTLAKTLRYSVFLLVRENGFMSPPAEGEIVRLPERRNLFVVDGETKSFLCGSEERYEELNGTKICYPTMTVALPD